MRPTTRTALVALALPALAACGAFLGLSGDDDDDPVPTRVPDAASDGSNVSDASGTNDAPAIDANEAAATVDAGPTERYVFVTSAVYQGDLGGLFGADQKCNQRANFGDARLQGRSFVAYVSVTGSSTISAATRLNPNGPPFKRLDGTIVAGNKDVFVTGPIVAPINVDENGAGNISAGVWTGTLSGGAPSGADCTAWTSAVADAGTGTNGSTLSNATFNGFWVNAGEEDCSESRRLYCVEP